MAFWEKLVLKDTVEIETTPEKIWQFWAEMDKNYKSWHPEDHIVFRWIKGKPMEDGSAIYAEETVGGKLVKGKSTIAGVVPNRKFALKLTFPRSLFCRYEYLIEPRGTKTAFSAITNLKYPACFRKSIQAGIKVGEKHVKEEGENLKNILEKK